MHIPDGYLNFPTWAGSAAIAAAGLGIGLKKTKAELNEKQVPLLGVLSAFLFALQMLNFPVGPRISGHPIGGVISSVLVGPWSTSVIISMVLIVQCFLFQDGGYTALGANMIVMAFVGPFVGFKAYLFLNRILSSRGNGYWISVFASSWLSVVASALTCSLLLAIGGLVPVHTKPLFALMTGVHMLIGIGEGIVSAMILTFVARTRPDLVGFKAGRITT